MVILCFEVYTLYFTTVDFNVFLSMPLYNVGWSTLGAPYCRLGFYVRSVNLLEFCIRTLGSMHLKRRFG